MKGCSMKTGIKAWPRVPEQMTTDYRVGSFLCPQCGAPMRVIVPGFDLDELPEESFGIWLSCSRLRNEGCPGRVRLMAKAVEIIEETPEPAERYRGTLDELLGGIDVNLDEPLNPNDD